MWGSTRLLVVSGAVVPLVIPSAVAIPAVAGDAAMPAATDDTRTPGVADGRHIERDHVRRVNDDPGRRGADRTESSVAGDIRLAFELFRTPDRPGEIRVRLTAIVPDDVTEVTLRVAPSATATSLDGFASTDEDGAFEWDGETAEPTITYRLPVNRTGDASTARSGASFRNESHDAARVVSGAARVTLPVSEAGSTRAEVGTARDRYAGDARGRSTASSAASSVPQRAQETDGLLYADPGPWALIQLPRWRASYTFRGSEPTVRATYDATGEGAIGGRTAFLGPHETLTRSAAGQRIRLIVPAAARPTADPSRVLDVLANASDALRVGDRDETTFAVVAPTTVAWGPTGLANGDTDFWVRADERLRTADDVWLHEYVHTRQAYRTADDARWLVEGTADYYAAKLALRFGLIGYQAFADQLERGRADRYADATLVDLTTWEPRTPYAVGALVAGHLDRRIALATNATLQAVLRRFDDREEPVTARTVRSVVRETANDSVADDADRYATTTDRPPVWTASAHDAAFGSLPARIETTVVGYEITGPYRETANETAPTAVVPAETFTVRVLVANEGASSGRYTLRLAVDDAAIAAAEGSLAPGESAVVPLTYTVGAAENATVTLNGERLDVRVREPAVAELTDVATETDRVRPGETVSLTVTVVNPTERTIDVVVDGNRVAAPIVRLAPGAETTVTVPVSIETAGERTISVGDHSVAVVVTTPTATDPTDTDISATGEAVTNTDTPGFGPVLAAVALLLVGWRRRS